MELVSAFFLVYPLTQRHAVQPVGAEPGSIVCVSVRKLSEEFPFPRFLARAVRTWGIWCIIS